MFHRHTPAMHPTKFRIYDGEKWHTLSITKRLVIGPNGTWTFRAYSKSGQGRDTTDVLDWNEYEIIAHSAHDDHKLEIEQP